MPIEVQSQQVAPGQSCSFTFSDNVTQQLVGFGSFQLSYGEKTSHHVMGMKINLSQIEVNGANVTVTPDLELFDYSGAHIDSSHSWVTVVVIAWAGPPNNELNMSYIMGIVDGGQSESIQLPSGAVVNLQPVLSGYDVNYVYDDYTVQSVSAGVGVTTPTPLTARMTASVQMNDGNGVTARDKTADGGLFANFDPAMNVEIIPFGSLQKSSFKGVFSRPFKNIVPVIIGFNAIYNPGMNHFVRAVGATAEIDFFNGQVFEVSGSAIMNDAGSSKQDDNHSYVNGFVIAC